MMRIIILQDAAAIYALHPSRMNHQLFDTIVVFKTKEFESYCIEMKEWLSEAEDPTNTSIELALPSVNTRLNEISNDGYKTYQVVNRIERNICSLKEDVSHAARGGIKEGLKEVLPTVLGPLITKSITNCLSTAITAAAQSLSVHETGGASDTVNNLLSLNLENNTDNIETVSTITQQQIPQSQSPVLVQSPPGYGHVLSLQPSSITAMCDEWYGIGSFLDVPIIGGVEELENKYNNAWRKKQTSANAKVFSRWKTVMDCIKKQQESNSVTQEEILVEFDVIFRNENGKKGNLSISKFIVELERRNIHRPPKRKKRNKLPPSNEIDNGSIILRSQFV
mmetsp:Transcript_22817/g.23101  ORF Transcript_22817/g.23101 Transcript_22817/m.23101 type:complete len:337 (-) Transcript_22817:105-1115(-)